MKADFFDFYFDELTKDELAVLRKQKITKEKMPEYSYMTTELTEKNLISIMKRLGVQQLPKSYLNYLMNYGDGGQGEIDIYGVYRKKDSYKLESRLVEFTLYYRKICKFPKYLLAIATGKWPNKIIFCLDTSRMIEGECPVVVYNQKEHLIKDYANTFKDFVRKYIRYGINWRIEEKREMEEKNNDWKLLMGIGCRCCWMVVKGVSEKSLIEVLNLCEKKKMTWEEGCSYIYDYINLDKRPVMISSRYQGKIYVIGNGLLSISYDLKKLLQIGGICNRVYFYFTNHITKSHGFAKLKKGQIERLYFSDEERIWSMGTCSEAERQLNFYFPKDFKDVFEKEYTYIDEDCIIDIASKWTPEDLENYPYKDVIVGNMKRKK